MRLLMTAVVSLGFGLPASAHPFHITLAEAEYNAETGKLEVALRIYHPTDLEEALSRRAGRRINLEKTEGADDLIMQYLRENFVIEPPGGKPAPLEWVGKEVSLKTAWLYFEVPLPGGPEGVAFRNRLLFDVERDQSNTIVFKQGERRASLRFSRERDRRVFSWAASDPEPKPSRSGAGLPRP